jgi:serine phosphatase RsbU (regulator of sigma subunit)
MSWPSRLLAHGVSLKLVIFLTYVSLVVACAGSIAFLTYQKNSKLILNIARASFDRTGVETISNTAYLLQPVRAAVEALATVLDEDDSILGKASLSHYLFEMVALYPQLYSSYVGLAEEGRFIQVQRIDPSAKTWGPNSTPLPEGSRYVLRKVVGTPPDRVDAYRYIAKWGKVVGTETVGNATYEPRARPFYVSALERPHSILTDTYLFASNGKPGITIARRIEKDGAPIGVVAADITLESLSRFLTAQPVGAHGVAIIVDASGNIVAAPESTGNAEMTARLRARRLADLKMPEIDAAWASYRDTGEKIFTFDQPDGGYIAAFHPFPANFDKDWVIMEVAPIDDFVGRLKQTIRQIAFFSAGIAALGGIGSLFLAGFITRPIEWLAGEADRIRSLVFEGPIRLKSNISEIHHLIDSMSAMKTAIRTLAGDETDQAAVEALVHQADLQSPQANLFRKVIKAVETKRARETELELASAIQHSVLPSASKGGDDVPVEIGARMRAAREIGGDFYDWVWRDEDRLAFVIGDVSGKGIPAALFMSSTRTAVRTMFMSGATLTEAVEGTNRLLAENNDRCFFVTLFIAELDVSSGRLSYVNAGHEPARVIGAAGAVRELEPSGPALGVIEDVTFGSSEIQLSPGDTIIALTDGVTDAVNAAGERFGGSRVDETLVQGRNGSANDMVAEIFVAVDSFAGSEEQFDDITCLTLRYRGGREGLATAA